MPKTYVPIYFHPVTNKEYQNNYEEIFRKNKNGKEAKSEPSGPRSPATDKASKSGVQK